MPPPAPIDDPIRFDELVRRGLGSSASSVTQLAGGASPRRFHRVATANGRAIVMEIPEPSAPPGWPPPPPRWAFVEVRDLLAERGVRVPRLLAEDRDAGLLLVEDLGDETLEALLARAPERREEAYRAAVVDLAAAQQALANLPASSIVARRAFDETLLRWELDHFREWGLEPCGSAFSEAARREYGSIADALARRIAQWPRGFVHRDYQSTNLMVRDARGELELVWIDFQDALLGPRVYDLVGLLCDSYQTIDRPFVDARLGDYADAFALSAADRAELAREFDVVTVQRKLKDAGRFVYLARVRGLARYLPFVEPTLALVHRALEHLADEAAMRALDRLLRDVRQPTPRSHV